MEANINRKRTPNGTFGELYYNNEKLCDTLEPVNPLPAGRYQLRLVNSPKFTPIYGHEMIQIDREPDTPYHKDKNHQLFHPGNTIEDTDNCVIVGKNVDYELLSSSKNTYNKIVYPILSNAIQLGDVFITITETI